LIEQAPAPGVAVPIADGLWWARLDLPFRLNHVNVWALDDGDGWSIVDCGANTAETEAAWRSIEAGLLHSKPVIRLIATHGHTDHIGYAGPFVRRHACGFHMTLAEWFSGTLRFHEAASDFSERQSGFFSMHGCRPDEIGSFGEDRERVRRHLAQLPGSFTRMRAGERLRIGDDEWLVMTHGGHSPEHASFYSRERRILIAGDQVLPKISPVIGVFPSEPDADPLGEYLSSLDALANLPEDVVVLPSHGLPYRGLHARLAELRAHHRHRLSLLSAAASEPKTALELAEVLFARAMREGQSRLALAETVAHLNYLEKCGELEATFTGGRKYFRSSARGAA